jgi:galactokinase
MSLDSANRRDGDGRVFAERLVGSGMEAATARAKGRAFGRALTSLRELDGGGDGDPYLLFVPGRIEVLGKHTDYAGGRSLLATTERGFCIAATARKDQSIRVVDVSDGSRTDFDLGPDLVPTIGHWSNYPMTVARRVARNFPGCLQGADIAFLSDLPPAAGMSSSSALMIGIFHVLAHVNRLMQREEAKPHLNSPEALAGYLATIENGQSFGPLAGDRGVGTFGGSEDHTAMCCCRPGQFHLYSFCPVRMERTIPFPAGHRLAIASSGVLAEKTGEAMAKYNRASLLVSALLELWRTGTGRADRSLADAIRSSADAPDRLRRIIVECPHVAFDQGALSRRLEQFIEESERIIPTAASALEQGELKTFGALVDESQRLTEELLDNQVPQTICLARTARRNGALAASAFGAGFGGSVWALVEMGMADAFLAAWARDYRQHFPAECERATFFLSGAGPGITTL